MNIQKIKPIRLETLLRKEGKKETDVIKWEYRGYGYFIRSGELTRQELPRQVVISKCFQIVDGRYVVDGAL